MDLAGASETLTGAQDPGLMHQDQTCEFVWLAAPACEHPDPRVYFSLGAALSFDGHLALRCCVAALLGELGRQVLSFSLVPSAVRACSGRLAVAA